MDDYTIHEPLKGALTTLQAIKGVVALPPKELLGEGCTIPKPSRGGHGGVGSIATSPKDLLVASSQRFEGG